MALLAVLPAVLVEASLAYLDHDDLHAIERTNHALAAALRCGRTWEELARQSTVVSDHDAPTDPQSWKRLACILERPTNDNEKLLERVLCCSSMDREEENPTNTLEMSSCWRTIKTGSRRATTLFGRALRLAQAEPTQIAQYECGCFGGTACYWSTSGSINKNTNDFIEYEVKPLSRVNSIQIIPYCAHWQPDHPTYGPVAVSLAFYKTPDSIGDACTDRELIYQSPVYHLPNEMELHTCVLPEPVWLPHGAIMRLELFGRYQHGTFEHDTQFYYTTLSFVGAVGTLVTEA